MIRGPGKKVAQVVRAWNLHPSEKCPCDARTHPPATVGTSRPTAANSLLCFVGSVGEQPEGEIKRVVFDCVARVSGHQLGEVRQEQRRSSELTGKALVLQELASRCLLLPLIPIEVTMQKHNRRGQRSARGDVNVGIDRVVIFRPQGLRCEVDGARISSSPPCAPGTVVG